MTELSFADKVAIAKLAFYSVAFPLTVWVSLRHGLNRSSGWIFLCIFSVLRIISASAQIATITNDSQTTEEVAMITGFIGLSPLLLATLGLLSRLYFSILTQPWRTMFSIFLLRIIQTPAAVALILCIVGATSANSPLDIASQGTVQAGIAVYFVITVVLCILTLGAAIGIRRTRRGEVWLLKAIALSLPLILVRVIYSMAGCFADGGNSTFNPVTGSAVVELCMATIEEMLIVLIYVWAGLRKPAVPDNDPTIEGSPGGGLEYRLERGDFGGGKLGLLSLGAHVLGDALRGHQDQSERLHTGHD